MNFIMILIANLPEILKLLENLDKRNKDMNLDKKVASDLKELNKAFEDKDEKKINEIFNRR